MANVLVDDDKALGATKLLSDTFADACTGSIHVIVKAPSDGECLFDQPAREILLTK
jgi:hypothetical protein